MRVARYLLAPTRTKGAAALLVSLGLLGASCTSTTQLDAVSPAADATSATEPATSSEPAASPGGETQTTPATASEPAAQDAIRGTDLGAVRLGSSRAEELDRIDLVGLDGEVTAAELAMLATFEGQEVAFAVFEDAAGPYVVAPLNPVSPGTDGSLELRLTNGTDTGPPLTLDLTGLPAAPGAGARYAASVMAAVDGLAADQGTSFEQLQAVPIAEISDELLPIKILQEFVDDGSENDLLSALTPGESGLTDEQMALLDAIIAKIMPERPDRRARSWAAGAIDGSVPTTTVHHAVVGAQDCIRNAPPIGSASELVGALKVGVDATQARQGAVAKIWNDVGTALNWGTLVPVVGPVSGGLGLVLASDNYEEQLVAGSYPSKIGDLTGSVSTTTFDEDFLEAGTWSEIRLTASSTGYDALGDTVSLVTNGISAKVSGAANIGKVSTTTDVAVDLTTKTTTNVGARFLKNELGVTRTYCANSWTVDVTGEPYTSARSTLGTLEVDSAERTFAPKAIGNDQLVIAVDQTLFSGLTASTAFAIETKEMQLRLSPDRIEVRDPGDVVEISIEFDASETEKATWATEAGQFLDGDVETVGEVTRSLITPESVDAYPFFVTAESSATTGLHAGPNPPPRATDAVLITVAELFVDPPNASVAPGGQLQYTATTRTGEEIDVDWETTGGTIDDDGLFTAGEDEGLFSVTATSIENTQVGAGVPVRVVDNGCLVGRWSIRVAPFFQALSARSGGAGVFEFVSGEYFVTLFDDSSFAAERSNLLMSLTAQGQTIVLEINSTESGTYAIEGQTIAITETQSNAVVEMIVPGVGAFASPVDAPAGLGGTGPYTCEDGLLTTSFDGIVVELDYVGEPLEN